MTSPVTTIMTTRPWAVVLGIVQGEEHLPADGVRLETDQEHQAVDRRVAVCDRQHDADHNGAAMADSNSSTTIRRMPTERSEDQMPQRDAVGSAGQQSPRRQPRRAIVMPASRPGAERSSTVPTGRPAAQLSRSRFEIATRTKPCTGMPARSTEVAVEEWVATW